MSLFRASSAAAAFTFLASRAEAQLPVFVPAEPEPSPPPAATEPAPAATEAPLPPPPPPPAATTAPPAVTTAPPAAATAPSAPAPAKTDHLAPQGVVQPPREEADVDDSELGRPRRRWYGWQTLIADGASFALIIAGGGGDGSDTLVTMGLLGYEFAPGIVHFAHGNPGRGFASFGIRLGMPLAGAFLGAATASGCDNFECEVGGAALGLLLGMGGAIAIDAAVFAYDDPVRRDEDAARIVPLLGLGARSAWVGLGGRL